MKGFSLFVLPLAVLTTALSGCGKSAEATNIDPSLMAAFPALPADMNGAQGTPSKAIISLGKRLFFETRLSKDYSISCNSCHGLDTFGVDHARFSKGVGGQLGARNAPTVFNAASHIAQFWDGRAADVEEQAKGPILNPVEMAMESAEAVVTLLQADASYVADFRAAFPDDAAPVSYDNLGRAIGAFERQLVTPGPWDAFVQGDSSALNEAQKQGFVTFTKAGCQAYAMSQKLAPIFMMARSTLWRKRSS